MHLTWAASCLREEGQGGVSEAVLPLAGSRSRGPCAWVLGLKELGAAARQESHPHSGQAATR